MRDELLYQGMALLLLFTRLLPVAIASLTVPSAGLAGRAIRVALPSSSQLISLVSIATLSSVTTCHFLVGMRLLLLATRARLRRLGGLLSLPRRGLLVRGLAGTDRLGGSEGEEIGIVRRSLLVVL